MAEAAEKRLQSQEHRGIKNPDSVKRQQQRKEEMERKEEELARMGNAGEAPLRVLFLRHLSFIINLLLLHRASIVHFVHHDNR